MDIALNGGKKEFEQFSEPLNKWYKVNIYSPEKYYFITHFVDISKEIEQLTELKNLREIVQETELKYKPIVDYAYDWETWEDGAGKLEYVSPACERISGYTVDEFVENESLFAYIIVEEDKEIWLNHRHKIGNEKGAHVEQFRIRNRNGKIIWIEHTCRPVLDKKGLYFGYRSNNRDITDRKYSEEMIKDSEERFRIIFEQASVGICNTSPEGRFLMVNQKFCEILGYSREELTEIKFNDITHPDDINTSLEGSAKLLNGSIEQFLVEKRYLKKDGSIIWVNLTSTLMKDSEGQPNYFITALHDITERKMMEESLKKSEEEYRLLFENAVEAIVVIQNRVIQICNPMAQRLTGYSEKELMSMPFLDLIYYENVENVRNIHNIRLKEEGYNSKHIFRLVRKNKEIRWAESNGIKINWKGKEAVLNFVIDITERKNAEEALRSNQKQLTDIIKFLPDATLAIDKERRVIIWNKAIEKMTCIPATEMIGKCDYAYTIPFYGEARPLLMDLVFPDAEEIATQYSNLSREGDTLMAEVFCPALYNNKGAWVFVKVSPLHDQSGNIIGAIESIRDITERKQAEEALKESEEKHRLLITQMQQGLAVNEVILDEAGKVVDYRFLDVNESFERATGLKHENIIGKTALEIVPETGGNWIEKFGHVAMTGEPLQYENYSQGQDKYFEVVAYSPQYKQFAIIISDITKRKRLETALSNEKKLLETTLISVGDGVISTDHKGNVVFVNRVAEFLTGWTQEAAMGKLIEEVFDIVNELTREKCENIVKKVIESRMILELANHTILISKNGIERPIEDSAAPIVQENGEIVGVVLVFRDFSEKKKKLQEIEFLSYHDQLTGLYNRRFYEEELKRLDTVRNLPMTIAMGDVNGLKLINDSFGHVMGDEFLKKVAEVIKKGCRADDIIARLGGDEFVIILPKTNAFEAEQIIKRINDLSLKEKIGTIDISISFGHETKNNEEEKIQEVFKKTEDYMYKKKLFESPSVRGKTIRAIISTLHEKNKREEQHSHRVSALCKSMGKALGLSEQEIEELKSVGLLHDIGKIAIDDNILNKPGKLTDDEWKEIKRHPEIGYRILSTVNDMSEMAEYVLAHHERWDGKGYPRGLKGEEIPFASRILAIADAYDAMTSERSYRSYRSALPDEVALEELQKNAGIQFDPKLGRVFIDAIVKKKCEPLMPENFSKVFSPNPSC